MNRGSSTASPTLCDSLFCQQTTRNPVGFPACFLKAMIVSFFFFLQYFFIHSHASFWGNVNSYFGHNLRDITPGLCYTTVQFIHLIKWNTIIIRVLNVLVSSTNSTIGLLRPETLAETLELLFCLSRKI